MQLHKLSENGVEMDNKTMDVRRLQWPDIIRRCNESGMTRTDWCRENNVSLRSFYYHQTKLRRQLYDALEDAESVCALPVKSRGNNEIAEIPITAECRAQCPEFIAFSPDAVIKPDGIIVGISNSLRPSLLEVVLKQLSHAE